MIYILPVLLVIRRFSAEGKTNYKGNLQWVT